MDFPILRLKIKGHSMGPTYSEGDEVLVCNFLKIKTGDIIAFKHKSEIFIKRVKEISGKEYFLEGDNKRDSYDSRTYGKIPKNDIIGKVILKL